MNMKFILTHIPYGNIIKFIIKYSIYILNNYLFNLPNSRSKIVSNCLFNLYTIV